MILHLVCSGIATDSKSQIQGGLDMAKAQEEIENAERILKTGN